MEGLDSRAPLIAMVACFVLAALVLRRIQVKASDTALPQEISRGAEFVMLSMYFVGTVVVAVLAASVLPEWTARIVTELWMWLYVYPIVSLTKAVLRVHKP